MKACRAAPPPRRTIAKVCGKREARDNVSLGAFRFLLSRIPHGLHNLRRRTPFANQMEFDLGIERKRLHGRSVLSEYGA